MSKKSVEEVKRSVTGVRKSEMFPKIPPGYRMATPEEELEIFKRGTVINSSNQTIRRCEAEIERAKMEIQAARRQLGESQAVLGALHKKLGINGDANDIITGSDGRMAILVDKAKRDAALKALQKPEKKPAAPKEGAKEEEGSADDE